MPLSITVIAALFLPVTVNVALFLLYMVDGVVRHMCTVIFNRLLRSRAEFPVIFFALLLSPIQAV